MYVWIDCIDDDTDDHLLQLIPDSIQAAISWLITGDYKWQQSA
jgi:hypothetical protein